MICRPLAAAARVASLLVLAALALPAPASESSIAAAKAPSRSGHDLRASTVIGHDLLDENGWIVGKVQDILFDPESGRIRYLAVTVGGRFEANTPPLAIELPSDKLKVTDGKVHTTLPYRQLGHLPQVSSAMEDLDPAVRKRILSARALIDADLRDAQGRDLGEIHALIVDLHDGEVRYAVADYDPSWLASGKFVALHKLQVRKEGKDGALVVLADEARLRSDKGFEDERWPAISNGTWSGRLHRWVSID